MPIIYKIPDLEAFNRMEEMLIQKHYHFYCCMNNVFSYFNSLYLDKPDIHLVLEFNQN